MAIIKYQYIKKLTHIEKMSGMLERASTSLVRIFDLPSLYIDPPYETLKIFNLPLMGF